LNLKLEGRTIFRAAIVFILILSTLIWWANREVVSKSQQYIYDDVEKVPALKTGLLLGTSKYLKNGKPNQYFSHRVTAAVLLYKAGKVKNFIISGDNSRAEYNEPLDLKNELIRNGVPDSVIYLDYAGFRTFDSVIRAKEIFGQTSFISISQKFHNERTVYIARRYGIEAFGYNAEDVTAYAGIKTKIREVFARFKVFTDLLINRKPKFLGEKVVIR
jgi:SanA protein